MQKITTNVDYNPITKEWAKYSVNGLECERDAIYQLILDNQFYTGKINLNKKNHFEQHKERFREEKIEEHNAHTSTSKESRTHTTTKKNDTTSDFNANFSLDTKLFVKKFDPTSDEYKLLINKMIHVLDMLYEAQQNYNEYSSNFRMVFADCMRFLLEKITNFEAPYNNIMHKFSLEYTVFLFDMVALGLSIVMSKKDDLSGNLALPDLNFDLSSIKKQWDEQWKNSKKSKFLDNYLSVFLKQVDVVCNGWIENSLFEDESSQSIILNKFSEFKKIIQSIQTEKLSLDDSLPDIHNQPVPSKISSFFHVGKHHTPSNSSHKDAPVINMCPNNGS